MLVLISCASEPPVPLKTREGEEWLKTLSVGRAEFRTLRAEAKVEVKRGFRRAKFHASILAAAPDKLYIEASGFGFPAALLSVDGNFTRVYLPSEQRAYESKDSNAVGALLGVPLASQEWINLLLGRVPKHADKMERSSTAKGQLFITVTDSDQSGVLTLDRSSGKLLSYEEKSPRSLRYTFEDSIDTVAGRYASHVRVVSESLAVDIHFKEVSANPSIEARLFKIDLPPGIEPLALRNVELWPH